MSPIIWEFKTWDEAIAFCRSANSTYGIRDLIPFEIFPSPQATKGRACVGWPNPNGEQLSMLNSLASRLLSIADLSNDGTAQIRLQERIVSIQSRVPTLEQTAEALRQLAQQDPEAFKRLRKAFGE